MSFFSCRNLNKDFDGEPVLKQVSIDFPERGLISIMGASGSGKSTLIHCLLGLEKCDGDIFFMNEKIRDFADFRNRHTGIVFQSFHLLDYLNAEDNICLFSRRRDAEEIVGLLNLKDKLDVRTSLLSGGEKQRVAIARTLLKKPEIIFCDEITGSLDEENGEKIMQYLKKISEKALIIHVTHHRHFAEKYSDRVFYLKDHTIKEERFETVERKAKTKRKRISAFRVMRLAGNLMKKSKFKTRLSFLSLLISCSLLGVLLNVHRTLNDYFNQFKNSYLDSNFVELSLRQEMKIENTSFTLVKQTRPEKSETEEISHLLKEAVIGYNFGNFLNAYTSLMNKSTSLSMNLYPCSSGLLHSYSQVIVNEKARSLLKDPFVDFSLERSVDYIDENGKIIGDAVNLTIRFEVVGVNAEMSFFDEPTIYYSYSLMEEYLCSIPLENLSSKEGEEISLGKRIIYYSYDGDYYDTGSIYLIFSDSFSAESAHRKINAFSSTDYDYLAKNRNLENYDSLNLILKSAGPAVVMFMTLTFSVSLALLALTLNSLILDEEKEIAVFQSLGVLQKQIYRIVAVQSGKIVFGSFIFSYFVKAAAYFWLERKLNFLNFTSLNQLAYENFWILILNSCVFFLFSLFIRYFIKRIDTARVLKEE